MITVSLDELMKDYKPSKWWQFIGRLERFIQSPRSLIYSIKYFVQRGKRGYSDRDLWSADMYIAEVIAGILESYTKNKLGVSYPYMTINGDLDHMFDEMVKDYSKYAKLFKEYADNGLADSQEWKDRFGGLTEEEIKDTLIWLSNIYTGLWD